MLQLHELRLQIMTLIPALLLKSYNVAQSSPTSNPMLSEEV